MNARPAEILTHAFEKLHVRSRAEAVAKLMRSVPNPTHLANALYSENESVEGSEN